MERKILTFNKHCRDLQKNKVTEKKMTSENMETS